jgi:hypothetical protein
MGGCVKLALPPASTRAAPVHQLAVAALEHGDHAAYIIDEGALSFVAVIYFPIWILHTDDNEEEQ